jgi:hypothetical protein
MFKGKELIRGLEQFGRWNVQEFVTRSRDTKDVLTYLQAERIFELFSATSFSTKDSVKFERRTGLPFIVGPLPEETALPGDAFQCGEDESD